MPPPSEHPLDRAYLADPLPSDATSFKARVEEGRARLNLIAQEVARLWHTQREADQQDRVRRFAAAIGGFRFTHSWIQGRK